MSELRTKQIEAAARMLCFLNAIPECNGSHPDCDPPCTPQSCPHGMRDYGEMAESIVDAVRAVGERGRAVSEEPK